MLGCEQRRVVGKIDSPTVRDQNPKEFALEGVLSNRQQFQLQYEIQNTKYQVAQFAQRRLLCNIS